MLEGAQAYEQAVAVLTARNKTGLSTDELLQHIDRDRLVGKLAGGPLAFFGPMNTFGVVTKETVHLGPDGRLRMSSTMLALMRAAQEGMVMNPQHMRETKVGCPLLKMRSGATGVPYGNLKGGPAMTQLAHEFVELVRANLRVYRRPSVPITTETAHSRYLCSDGRRRVFPTLWLSTSCW